MKATRRRLRELERRLGVRILPPVDELTDKEFLVSCQGGGVEPLPSAGPRPARYANEEQWQKHHRFLLALCCRSVGRADPPEMTAEERREVDKAVAFFVSLEPTGALSLHPQADLASSSRC